MPVNMKVAQEFEIAIKKWTGSDVIGSEVTWSPVDAILNLQQAADLQTTALSCGIAGFHFLHGLLEVVNEGSVIRSELITLEAPTYYGMMAVVFHMGK